MLIMGAIMLNGFVAGLLMRPIDVSTNKKKAEGERRCLLGSKDSLNNHIKNSSEMQLISACETINSKTAIDTEKEQEHVASLLTDVSWLVYQICTFLITFGYQMPKLFIVDRAVNWIGIEVSRAAIFIPAISAFDIVSRILSGIAAPEWKVRLILFILSPLLCGILNCLSFISTSFILILVQSMLFGLFYGKKRFLYSYVFLKATVLDLYGTQKAG